MVVVILAIIAISGWFIMHSHEKHTINPISEYEDLLKQSESTEIISSESSTVQVSLTTMLESGIYTLGGVIQSTPESGQFQITNYHIMLNNRAIGIKAVSEIDLVKAFLVNGQQVLLLGYDQGGNECARKYQFVTISESNALVSKSFGSCLPITNIAESGNSIQISTPQNNPYLGDDFNFVYEYANGDVMLISKPTKQSVKSKYANITPAQIIQKATQDGCYQDGVLLDDGACAGGRKYCTMFKSITKPLKDSNYQLLKDFCS